MSSIHWICLLLFLFTDIIGRVQSTKPSLKLTFSPDETYLPRDQPLDIQCDLINPKDKSESSQLWHVDLKTHKRTAISRLLLTSPNADAPEVFRTIKNHRYEFLRKNRMRIRRLQLEDSARYECDCPDCEDVIPKQSRDLYVMKLAEPKWIIEPGLPLHENTQATIKCHVEEFYPYVSHKILRNDKDISQDGKLIPITNSGVTQKFLWEQTINPTADWHNSTLRCLVTEGNSEQQATQTLDVLFAPRFLICKDRQHIDSQQESTFVECSFSGNPSPTLIWRRHNHDQRIIGPEAGIQIETIDEQNGRYKSFLRFNRTKLSSMPVATNSNGTQDENYYQELLNGGFIAQLTINNVEKAKQIIRIDRHASQARSSPGNRGEKSTRIVSSILFSSLVLYVAIFLL